MDQYLFAFLHPFQHLIAALFSMYSHRYRPFAVGMAGTHDRCRESLFPIKPHQRFLTGDLVAGIFPIGICQRRPFIDPVIRQRFLIRRSRTDQDILFRPLPEQTKVPLHIFWCKRNKICNHIKLLIPQLFRHTIFVLNLSPYHMYPFRQSMIAVSPIDQPQLMPLFYKPFRYRHTDGPCSSDQQHFHTVYLLDSSALYFFPVLFTATVCEFS